MYDSPSPDHERAGDEQVVDEKEIEKHLHVTSSLVMGVLMA
jgi:hypothetical protein